MKQGNYSASVARICQVASYSCSIKTLIKLCSEVYSDTKLMADSCIETVQQATCRMQNLIDFSCKVI